MNLIKYLSTYNVSKTNKITEMESKKNLKTTKLNNGFNIIRIKFTHLIKLLFINMKSQKIFLRVKNQVPQKVIQV